MIRNDSIVMLRKEKGTCDMMGAPLCMQCLFQVWYPHPQITISCQPVEALFGAVNKSFVWVNKPVVFGVLTYSDQESFDCVIT